MGIDALRADFGQGLPPQCWEYIINKTRRTAYGQALVLLNTSSHDEDHYQDPFHALLRFAANSTMDGVPLIFPGQELGISGAVVPPGDSQSGITPYGYQRYETNFGKPIPHFKKFNSLIPLWLQTQTGHASYNYGSAQLGPVYAAIGQARKFSGALRSSNRYFLDRTGGARAHSQIFSVAKYEAANTSPGVSDVVFAFVNLDRNASPSATFDVNITQSGANLFGIKAGRIHNVKNISAYNGVDATRRDVWLWGAGRGSADVLTNGVYVGLNNVPTSNAAWGTAPYEAQYLKLYDVTPALTQAFVKVSGSAAIAGTGTSRSFTDSAAAGSAKFYEVRLAP